MSIAAYLQARADDIEQKSREYHKLKADNKQLLAALLVAEQWLPRDPIEAAAREDRRIVDQALDLGTAENGG